MALSYEEKRSSLVRPEPFNQKTAR